MRHSRSHLFALGLALPLVLDCHTRERGRARMRAKKLHKITSKYHRQEPPMKRSMWGWIVLTFANVMAWCVLGFQQPIGAAPQDVKLPFDNAIQQRAEMIRELQEIK